MQKAKGIKMSKSEIKNVVSNGGTIVAKLSEALKIQDALEKAGHAVLGLWMTPEGVKVKV